MSEEIQEEKLQVEPTPLRCFSGTIMAGGLGFALYKLMISIATTFANKPITSDNQMARSIGSAVRTLVVGITALGTGIFGIVAIGLFALGVQLSLKQLIKKN